MAQTTRTLNPLPFQDLGPNRFEDLVRQLSYDFKQWRALEATGRSGGDDSYDMRLREAAKDEKKHPNLAKHHKARTAWIWAQGSKALDEALNVLKPDAAKK